MAIRGLLGETLRTNINHLDVNGLFIAGASFTVIHALRPDDTTFPVEFREITAGLYEAKVTTLPTDPVGEWFLLVQANNGAMYEEVFDLQAVNVPIFVPQAPSQSGPSRAELRRAVASSLGDLVRVTATEQGQEATIHDNVNLTQEVNAFNGMQIICISSAWPQNVGHIGTVMSNSPANRSINIEPPLPMVSMPGDDFDMYNYRGNGWRVDQYNAAINQAIVRAGDEHGPLPYTTTTDHTGEYMEIPLEFSHFSGVEAIGRDGKRNTLKPEHYRVSRGTRELSLLGKYSYKSGQYRTLRIIGSRRPDQLLSDDARTHMPADWVIFEAQRILLQHDVGMGITQGERDRLLAMAAQGADGRRSMVIRSFPPNTLKLPS